MWGTLAVGGPHSGCHSPRQGSLSGPSHSGSQVICENTVSGGPCVLCTSQLQAALRFSLAASVGPIKTSQVQVAQVPGCTESAQSQVGHESHALPQVRSLSGSWVCHTCGVSGGSCICTHDPSCLGSWVCHEVQTPGVVHASPYGSWSQAVTLLEHMNCPGSQYDMVGCYATCSQFDGRCG